MNSKICVNWIIIKIHVTLHNFFCYIFLGAWKQKLYDCKDRFEELQNLKLEPPENKLAEGLLNSFSKLFLN